MRGPLLVTLVVVVASALSAVAHAQATSSGHPSATERASIDSESAAATTAYLFGVPLHLGGGIGLLGASLSRATNPLACALASMPCRYDATGDDVGIAAGVSLVALGLALIIVAIVLDVDSGTRRRTLTLSMEGATLRF